VCGVLKLPESRLDSSQPFGALGLDSLMAIELRNRLEVELGDKLPASTAWNYPTLSELAAFARGRLEQSTEPTAAAATGPVPPLDPAGVVAAISDLSDDAALRALMNGAVR